MCYKELFYEIQNHLLLDEKPSVYLNSIKNSAMLLKYPFNMLKKLEDIDQSSKYHPEGNVWIHTMMVVDEGAKLREEVNNKEVFMWSLLLHDIGKPKATRIKNGRITSYNHDKIGEEETKKFLNEFNLNEDFVYKVAKMVRYHMHLLYISKNMPYGNLKGMVKEVDINDISWVFLSDRLGRGGMSEDNREEVIKEVYSFRNNYLN